MKKSPVLAIEKIQDAQICWQSNGYGVLGPQGCAVGGFHKKKNTHTTMKAVSYCATLEWLRAAIQQQRPARLTTGVASAG